MTTTHGRRTIHDRGAASERRASPKRGGDSEGGESGGGGCGGGGTSGAAEPRARSASRRDARRLLLLTTGTAADVLARLVDGDPLGLRARLRRRAAERFLLASPDGLFGPAAAHCARQAEGYRGRPAPEPWLERELDAVLDRWVAGTRGRDGDSKGGAGAGGGDGRSGASARGARTGGAVGGNGVTASAARHGDGELERCARRFNACGRAERATLWRLAFAGASLDELAHESGTDLSRTARRARRALDALLGRSEVAR